MKIVIQQLESIEGVEIFAIIALLIFFAFFFIMFVYTMKLDKHTANACGNIPLEDDDSTLSEL
jgi:cytochrome c oxidase cbb3-type subunit 4